MKELKKKIYCIKFMICLFFLICFFYGNKMIVCAQSSYETKLNSDLSFEYENDNEYLSVYINQYSSKPYLVVLDDKEIDDIRFYVTYYNANNKDATLLVSSSNTNVVKIKEGYERFTLSPITSEYEEFYSPYSSYRYYSNDYCISYEVCGSGVSTISLQVGDYSCCINVVVPPSYQKVTKITQQDLKNIKIEWKKEKSCSGYFVKRSDEWMNNSETIAVVEGENTLSATVQAEIGKKNYYYICPYIQLGDIRVEEKNSTYFSISKYQSYSYDDIFPYAFKATKMGASIQSVLPNKSSQLKITWDDIPAAIGYKLYVASSDNAKGKCIYSSSDHKTSYIHKVVRGKPYFYYVVTMYEEDNSDASLRVSGIIPNKKSASGRTQNKIDMNYRYGQYSWHNNWASSDMTYYYESGGKHFIVCVQNDNKTLNVYSLDSKMRMQNKKKITIGKFDTWGGFYHGIDDNFYVAMGYRNLKESDSKTVIKVKKYNKNWKLVKTCNIKGSAKNYYKGIQIPFRAGNCSMDMQNNTLYIATARTMYVHDDGLNHQSNIEFAIDTKTMKYQNAEDSYVSHSFNQIVKFKDGNLYQVDHGDAFPRTIVLSIVNNYRTEDESKKRLNLFEISGCIGDNFTGVNLGGMEVGSKNVIVCGTAQPNEYKIKNVTGNGANLGFNVFIIVAGRDGKRSTVKWLTKYNPKNSKNQVGETRIIKLSDDKFALLYEAQKNGKTTLNYVVLNNDGKKIYSKTYSNMYFHGESQPVIFNGYIQWTTKYINTHSRYETKTFRIPVIF